MLNNSFTLAHIILKTDKTGIYKDLFEVTYLVHGKDRNQKFLLSQFIIQQTREH